MLGLHYTQVMLEGMTNYLSWCALLPWIHMIVQVTVLKVWLIFIASEYAVGQEE
jgi:hypothetical protein